MSMYRQDFIEHLIDQICDDNELLNASRRNSNVEAQQLVDPTEYAPVLAACCNGLAEGRSADPWVTAPPATPNTHLQLPVTQLSDQDEPLPLTLDLTPETLMPYRDYLHQPNASHWQSPVCQLSQQEASPACHVSSQAEWDQERKTCQSCNPACDQSETNLKCNAVQSINHASCQPDWDLAAKINQLVDHASSQTKANGQNIKHQLQHSHVPTSTAAKRCKVVHHADSSNTTGVVPDRMLHASVHAHSGNVPVPRHRDCPSQQVSLNKDGPQMLVDTPNHVEPALGTSDCSTMERQNLTLGQNVSGDVRVGTIMQAQIQQAHAVCGQVAGGRVSSDEGGQIQVRQTQTEYPMGKQQKRRQGQAIQIQTKDRQAAQGSEMVQVEHVPSTDGSMTQLQTLQQQTTGSMVPAAPAAQHTLQDASLHKLGSIAKAHDTPHKNNVRQASKGHIPLVVALSRQACSSPTPSKVPFSTLQTPSALKLKGQRNAGCLVGDAHKFASPSQQPPKLAAAIKKAMIDRRKSNKSARSSQSSSNNQPRHASFKQHCILLDGFAGGRDTSRAAQAASLVNVVADNPLLATPSIGIAAVTTSTVVPPVKSAAAAAAAIGMHKGGVPFSSSLGFRNYCRPSSVPQFTAPRLCGLPLQETVNRPKSTVAGRDATDQVASTDVISTAAAPVQGAAAVSGGITSGGSAAGNFSTTSGGGDGGGSTHGVGGASGNIAMHSSLDHIAGNSIPANTLGISQCHVTESAPVTDSTRMPEAATSSCVFTSALRAYNSAPCPLKPASALQPSYSAPFSTTPAAALRHASSARTMAAVTAARKCVIGSAGLGKNVNLEQADAGRAQAAAGRLQAAAGKVQGAAGTVQAAAPYKRVFPTSADAVPVKRARVGNSHVGAVSNRLSAVMQRVGSRERSDTWNSANERMARGQEGCHILSVQRVCVGEEAHKQDKSQYVGDKKFDAADNVVLSASVVVQASPGRLGDTGKGPATCESSLQMFENKGSQDFVLSDGPSRTWTLSGTLMNAGEQGHSRDTGSTPVLEVGSPAQNYAALPATLPGTNVAAKGEAMLPSAHLTWAFSLQQDGTCHAMPAGVMMNGDQSGAAPAQIELANTEVHTHDSCQQEQDTIDDYSRPVPQPIHIHVVPHHPSDVVLCAEGSECGRGKHVRREKREKVIGGNSEKVIRSNAECSCDGIPSNTVSAGWVNVMTDVAAERGEAIVLDTGQRAIRHDLIQNSFNVHKTSKAFAPCRDPACQEPHKSSCPHLANMLSHDGQEPRESSCPCSFSPAVKVTSCMTPRTTGLDSVATPVQLSLSHSAVRKSKLSHSSVQSPMLSTTPVVIKETPFTQMPSPPARSPLSMSPIPTWDSAGLVRYGLAKKQTEGHEGTQHGTVHMFDVSAIQAVAHDGKGHASGECGRTLQQSCQDDMQNPEFLSQEQEQNQGTAAEGHARGQGVSSGNPGECVSGGTELLPCHIEREARSRLGLQSGHQEQSQGGRAASQVHGQGVSTGGAVENSLVDTEVLPFRAGGVVGSSLGIDGGGSAGTTTGMLHGEKMQHGKGDTGAAETGNTENGVKIVNGARGEDGAEFHQDSPAFPAIADLRIVARAGMQHAAYITVPLAPQKLLQNLATNSNSSSSPPPSHCNAVIPGPPTATNATDVLLSLPSNPPHDHFYSTTNTNNPSALPHSQLNTNPPTISNTTAAIPPPPRHPLANQFQVFPAITNSPTALPPSRHSTDPPTTANHSAAILPPKPNMNAAIRTPSPPPPPPNNLHLLCGNTSNPTAPPPFHPRAGPPTTTNMAAVFLPPPPPRLPPNHLHIVCTDTYDPKVRPPSHPSTAPPTATSTSAVTLPPPPHLPPGHLHNACSNTNDHSTRPLSYLGAATTDATSAIPSPPHHPPPNHPQNTPTNTSTPCAPVPCGISTRPTTPTYTTAAIQLPPANHLQDPPPNTSNPDSPPACHSTDIPSTTTKTNAAINPPPLHATHAITHAITCHTPPNLQNLTTNTHKYRAHPPCCCSTDPSTTINRTCATTPPPHQSLTARQNLDTKTTTPSARPTPQLSTNPSTLEHLGTRLACPSTTLPNTSAAMPPPPTNPPPNHSQNTSMSTDKPSALPLSYMSARASTTTNGAAPIPPPPPNHLQSTPGIISHPSVLPSSCHTANPPTNTDTVTAIPPPHPQTHHLQDTTTVSPSALSLSHLNARTPTTSNHAAMPPPTPHPPLNHQQNPTIKSNHPAPPQPSHHTAKPCTTTNRTVAIPLSSPHPPPNHLQHTTTSKEHPNITPPPHHTRIQPLTSSTPPTSSITAPTLPPPSNPPLNTLTRNPSPTLPTLPKTQHAKPHLPPAPSTFRIRHTNPPPPTPSHTPSNPLSHPPPAPSASPGVPTDPCENSLHHWDIGVQLYETFPWQKDAMDYCDWCSTVDSDAIKRLVSSASRINFANFDERWAHMQKCMKQCRKPPGQRRTDGGNGSYCANGGVAVLDFNALPGRPGQMENTNSSRNCVTAFGQGVNGSAGNAQRGVVGYSYDSKYAAGGSHGSNGAASKRHGVGGDAGNNRDAIGAARNTHDASRATGRAHGANGATRVLNGTNSAAGKSHGADVAAGDTPGTNGATANAHGTNGAAGSAHGTNGAATKMHGTNGAAGKSHGTISAAGDTPDMQGATAYAHGTNGAAGNTHDINAVTTTTNTTGAATRNKHRANGPSCDSCGACPALPGQTNPSSNEAAPGNTSSVLDQGARGDAACNAGSSSKNSSDIAQLQGGARDNHPICENDTAGNEALGRAACNACLINNQPWGTIQSGAGNSGKGPRNEGSAVANAVDSAARASNLEMKQSSDVDGAGNIQQMRREQGGGLIRQPTARSMAACMEKVRTFCKEYGKAGRGMEPQYTRHFVVTTYQVLWKQYWRHPAIQRHYYEIIRSDRPCHLYFDLEFQRRANQQRDGSHLVDVLMQQVRDLLRHLWGLDLEDSWVLELDSSTEVKFSRHVIIRIPGYAFAGNQVVGAFVSHLRSRPQFSCLMVAKDVDDPTLVSFVDSAVYSKTRHFRMIWSCKGGKTVVLEATKRYMCATASLSSQQLFLRSLICNVAPHCKLLDLPCMSPAALHEPNSSSSNEEVTNVSHPVCAGRSIKISWVYMTDSSNRACAQQLQEAAVKAIDFVETVGAQRAGGLETRVRSLAYCGEGGSVAYGMVGAGSHTCARIGRAHRSNHIFFVLDFATGVFCQKCYDPECAGYRSPWAPLPDEVWCAGELLPVLRPNLYAAHAIHNTAQHT